MVEPNQSINPRAGNASSISRFSKMLCQLEEEHAREIRELRMAKDREMKDLREKLLEPATTTYVVEVASERPDKNGKNSEDQELRDARNVRSNNSVKGVKSLSWMDGAGSDHTKDAMFIHMFGHMNQRAEQSYGDSERASDIQSQVYQVCKKVDKACGLGMKNSRLRLGAQRIVGQERFEAFCAFMIMTNCVMIAISTHTEAKSPGDELPIFYRIASRTFTAWFGVELAMRFISSGFYHFFFRDQCLWNMLDLFILANDAIQYIYERAASRKGVTSGMFRLLRILRIIRLLRILKLVAFFKEFRLMVMCVLQSGLMLFWSALFLFMIMFLFAVFISQNMSRLIADGMLIEPILMKHFGDLIKTMYTLFLSISGGVSWIEVSDPLFELDVLLGVVFLFYIFLVVFSLLNIISAIFVDTVVSNAHQDQEEVIEAQMKEYRNLINVLSDIFVGADKDKSKTLTFEEFQMHIGSSEVVAHLLYLGISVSEAMKMFKLLDVDGDGTLSIEEFVFGCLRMKGAARTIDLQTLMQQNKKLMQAMNRLHAIVLREMRLTKDLTLEIAETQSMTRLETDFVKQVQVL